MLVSDKKKNFVRILAVLMGSFMFAQPTMLGAAMSSANYVIETDVISVGGNRSTSANWIINDTIGELATGEDLSSASYAACAGYHCFRSSPFISFSVKEGTSSPGSTGAGVALGTLTTDAVTTSDGSTINSIFLTGETNAPQGFSVTIVGANGALKSTGSPTSPIDSVTETLIAGTEEGFGVCVFSTGQDSDSPSTFTKQSPYDGTCTKTTGHAVGQVSTSATGIMSASAELKAGTAEILVKVAIVVTTPGRPDYSETLTFIATGTY